MQWVTDLPAQSGIYWLKSALDAQVIIVQVNAGLRPDQLGSLDYMGTDDCGRLTFHSGDMWYGPITPPSAE